MNFKYYLIASVILLLVSISFSIYATSEMVDKEDELETVKSKLSEKEEEIKNIRSKISSLNEKIDDLESELDDCESAKSSLSNEIDDLDYRNRMNQLQQSVPEEERIIY